MKQLIAVGLGTRDRPEMLKEALDSLAGIRIPNEMQVLLIVCDNGTSDESKVIIQNIADQLPFRTILLKQEKQGIALMRNRILNKALNENADFVAFFDDDEEVNVDWLIELNNARIKYEADVIQGAVIQKFPKNLDTSMIEKFYPGSFQKNSGDYLKDAYTNNVLFDLSLIRSKNLRFSDRFNLTGGSDSYFFRQLKSLGAKIVFCKEAIVAETIPASRASIDWILSRYYRNGYTMHLMNVADYGRLNAFWIGMKYVYKSITTCTIIIFISKVPIDEKRMKKLNRCLRAKGVLHAMFGVPFEEYKSIHGA